MIDWTNHKFVLAWIKDNLSAYQFITQEAIQIKNIMERNPLETEENIKAFVQAYEKFLQLVERNPYTIRNENNEPASILVSDFYFFLYPTKQDILIPVGLQIEMGVTNTKEKAKEFKERLESSAVSWNKEYESANKQKMKLPNTFDKDADYERFLDKSGSTFSYAVRQLILLLIIAICLGGNILLYTQHVYESYGDLQLVALCGVTVISVLYLLKSLQWIAREKKETHM